MGFKNLVKKYGEYSNKELARRAAKYKSNVSSSRAYKSELKKELEEARRKTYREEALRQAAARGRRQAQGSFNTFGGLIRPPAKAAPVKKKTKKRKAVKRRRVVKYVYN